MLSLNLGPYFSEKSLTFLSQAVRKQMDTKLKGLRRAQIKEVGNSVGLVAVLLILAVNSFSLGYRFYERDILRRGQEKGAVQRLSVVERILRENFLFADKLPPEQLFDGAVTGMVNAAGDPYTRFITNREFQRSVQEREGQFGGIGVTINTKDTDSGLIIQETRPGLGAQAAGLLPNDKIIAVDGAPISGIPAEDAVALIRGEIGSSVSVTVKRDGVAEPIIVRVERKVVEIPSVSHEVIDGNLGIIRISNFSNTTLSQFDRAFKELEGKRITALILDLRGNNGGVLDVAVSLAGRFMPPGAPVLSINSRNFTLTQETQRESLLIAIPVVVLVDSGTASASEVLAGALQDNLRATLVGETTFGKGLIQNSFQIDESSAMIVTVSRYLTPSGRNIHEYGITPDMEIMITPEDMIRGIDTQLLKAKSHLRSVKEGR